MKIQISPRRVSIGVRVVVRRLMFHWFCLLQNQASKWGRPTAERLPVELSSRRKFLVKNFEIQERLRQVFAPVHHLCSPECSCCHHEVIPYGSIDGVLYGISPDLVLQSPFMITELVTEIFWENVLLVRSYFQRIFLGKTDFSSEEQDPQPQGGFCPALTERGCGLPSGRRPAFCVFIICGRFIREMDWRQYWRYVWISGRYCLHLTVSLRMVVAEWRHKQGKLA